MTKEDHIREAVERRGLTLERFGGGWRIHGSGIDILAAEVWRFDLAELNPHARPARQDARTRP